MTIGEKIYKFRIYLGLSQKDFADKVGTSQSAINYWENGKRQPRISQLKKIARFIDYPLYLLMDDNYELGDIGLEMKRARFVNSFEMTEPPKPFTVPLSQYNSNDNNIYIDPDLQNLYEIAMQKVSNKEKLTDEEEQVLIGIPGKLRKKTNTEETDCDSLLYENSHSFASSEEEYEALLRQRQKQDAEPSRKIPQSVDYEPDNNAHKYEEAIRINHNFSPEAIENLKEVSIIYKKIEKDEKLTENELQILKDYNHRQEIVRKRLKESVHEQLERLGKLQAAYKRLNEIGQEEAAKRIEELTEIPRYTKPDEPPQE